MWEGFWLALLVLTAKQRNPGYAPFSPPTRFRVRLNGQGLFCSFPFPSRSGSRIIFGPKPIYPTEKRLTSLFCAVNCLTGSPPGPPLPPCSSPFIPSSAPILIPCSEKNQLVRSHGRESVPPPHSWPEIWSPLIFLPLHSTYNGDCIVRTTLGFDLPSNVARSRVYVLSVPRSAFAALVKSIG